MSNRTAEQEREYRRTHLVQVAGYQHKYYETHKGQLAVYTKAYRQANRKRIAEHQRLYRKEQATWGGECYVRSKEFVHDQKVGKVCNRCGEADLTKLVFHHTDPATKLFGIGTHRGHSIQAIIAEIAKCELICKKCHINHHRTETWK